MHASGWLKSLPPPSNPLLHHPFHLPPYTHPRRSGQPDVALDAFLHMRSLGLAPSPAAFRAVLGVHLGRGDWEEADVVLGAMAEAPGALDAEVGAGHTAHGACSGGGWGRSRPAPRLTLGGRPSRPHLTAAHDCAFPPPPPDTPQPQLVTGIMERASGAGHLALVQSAYDHLVHAGESPASATFAALLGALRRQRPADEVAELALGLAEQAEAAGAAGAMQVGRAEEEGRGGAPGISLRRFCWCARLHLWAASEANPCTFSLATLNHPSLRAHLTLPAGPAGGLPRPRPVGPVPAAARGGGGGRRRAQHSSSGRGAGGLRGGGRGARGEAGRWA